MGVLDFLNPLAGAAQQIFSYVSSAFQQTVSGVTNFVTHSNPIVNAFVPTTAPTKTSSTQTTTKNDTMMCIIIAIVAVVIVIVLYMSIKRRKK